MQDKEFTMAKSLLTVLSGRARADKEPESSSSSQAKSHSSSKTKASSRRRRFDDKSGPPPPRGSVTDEKLSYLDWRLKRINNIRLKSERTSHCWIDGRDTIGRNSIDVAPLCRSSERASVPAPSRAPASAPASAPAPRVVAIAPGSIAAVIASEKAAGLKALENAMGGDSMLASMPRLAKRDSSSGSEMSGSSDSHDLIAPAAVLDVALDKDVGAVYFTRPRQSFLANIGSRLSKSSKKQHTLASKADAACQQTTARSHRSVARIWHS
ncbi:phosducin [Pseudozyma hubeiensis]|nr:phosducin [Pseudozyma hubeiensis]